MVRTHGTEAGFQAGNCHVSNSESGHLLRHRNSERLLRALFLYTYRCTKKGNGKDDRPEHALYTSHNIHHLVYFGGDHIQDTEGDGRGKHYRQEVAEDGVGGGDRLGGVLDSVG